MTIFAIIAALFALFIAPAAATAAVTTTAAIIGATSPVIIVIATIAIIGFIAAPKATGDAALAYGPDAWAPTDDTVSNPAEWLIANGVPAMIANMMASNPSTTSFTLNRKGYWDGTAEGALRMHLEVEEAGSINWFICTLKRNPAGKWVSNMTSEPREIGEDRPAFIAE